MPMNKKNTRHFTRILFAGMLERIILLKRDDNQRQGTVRSITLFQARKGIETKAGEPIDAEMLSDHRVTWHIPRRELDRVGVTHLNPADRIVEDEGEHKGRTWQPESTTLIESKIFNNEVDVYCLMVEPTQT